jgi:hypothetical protein
MLQFFSETKENGMKVFITIEEMVSNTFEIEENSVDEAVEIAKRKYNTGEFVLEPGSIINRMIHGREENSEEGTEWIEF